MPNNKTTLNETICKGEAYNQNGFNASDSGTYEQHLQNHFGCDSVVILELKVFSLIDTTFISAEICEGEKYTQNGFNASKSDIYVQNLKNHYGCDSVVVLDLTVNPLPKIEIIAISDKFCEEGFIELEIRTDGDRFQWDFGSSENPLTVTQSGTYHATAFRNTCKKTTSYNVENCPCEAWLPNAFTPNGDGLNDVWKPIISCSENLKDYKLHIYNRWGNIVFWSSDHATGWNGANYNGGDCSAGVYYCVIEFTDSKNARVLKSTSVTLLR
jgi:gliding motility-associated-like protein